MEKMFSWLKNRRTEGLNYKLIDSFIAAAISITLWLFDQKWLGFGIQVLVATLALGFLASIWLFEIEKVLSVIAQKITGKPVEVAHGSERQSRPADSDNVRPIKSTPDYGAETETEDASGDPPDGDDLDSVADLHERHDGSGKGS